MSKGLGASGRLITALVINQLKVNEREWGCPYTIKQAAEDMSWAKLQGREVLERFAEAEKIEIPEGWGRLNQNDVPAYYLDSNNQPGPLFLAMKKECARQIKRLLARDDCLFRVVDPAAYRSKVYREDDILNIKSGEDWAAN